MSPPYGRYAEADALQEAEAAFADVERGTPGAAARSCAAAAALQASQPMAPRTRHSWLRNWERPSPVVTSLLRPPAACRRVAALRRPDGSLSSDPVVMAQSVADCWRAVCARQPPDLGARAAVLGALRAAPRRCPSGAAAALGAAAVSDAEVRAALSAAPPGRAPGPDGIPAELYGAYSSVFVPLLAALFSAVGATGITPLGFLDGVISSLPKPGAVDPTSAASYRPITLTDTDYRTLARVLARRLSAVFGVVIDPEQTVFLQLRRIADNFWRGSVACSLAVRTSCGCWRRRCPSSRVRSMAVPPPELWQQAVHALALWGCVTDMATVILPSPPLPPPPNSAVQQQRNAT